MLEVNRVDIEERRQGNDLNGRSKLEQHLRLRGGLHTKTIGSFDIEIGIYDRTEEKWQAKYLW